MTLLVIMINFLRKIYTNQNIIRSVWADRFLVKIYARWMSYQKKGKIQTVFIEISSICNLSCMSCYRTGVDYPSKNINMSFNTFKNIVDSVPADINYLLAQGIGESACNKELKRMLQYASDSKKFHTIIMTSNLLLGDAEFYQSLFACGLDRLTVSIDSFDPEICDKIRKATDTQKLYQNTFELVKNYPDRVNARITVSPVNLPDLEKTITCLIKLKIKKIEIDVLVDYKNNQMALKKNDICRIESIIKKLKKATHITFDTYGTCILPFTTLTVNARGMVMPCCRIFDDAIINFGHIFSGLQNTCYSKKFDNIRSTFYKKIPEFCKECHHSSQ